MDKVNLTDAQKRLIECLKFLKVEDERIIGIMLLVKTDEQISAMADYILKTPTATSSMILEKGVEISDTYKGC